MAARPRGRVRGTVLVLHRGTAPSVASPRVLALRLLLLLLYTAPLTAPVVAIVLHSAAHEIDDARRDLAWGLPESYLEDLGTPHSHPYVGDHVHGEDGGHGGAVGAALAAADAVERETDPDTTIAAPLRLAAHLPSARPFHPAADVADRPVMPDVARRRHDLSFTPPTPPPRSPVSA